MKGKLLLILSVLFLAAFVAAQVRESNFFLEGHIKPDGSLAQTSIPVNSVNVIGFTCTSPRCATVSTQPLFGEQPLTSNGNSIELTYPTSPRFESNYGYGVFMYKEGYIPYEVATNWTGNGNVGPYSNYLSKKEVCTAATSNMQISSSVNQIQVSVTAQSPISHSGELDYVPAQITDQYAVDVNITFIAQGATTTTQSQIISVPYSASSTATATLAVPAGSYSVTAQATVPDAVCLSTTTSTQSATVTVQGPSNGNTTDTTPPAPVTNLNLQAKGATFITWNWTNPTNTDFAHVRIFLNGVFVGTTAGTTYTALGLLTNTTHTITLNTVDTTGNINQNGVSNTQMTLANGTTGSAPASVSNLRLSDRTDHSLHWEWTNPTDADFSHVIVYLDGVNIRNTTSISYTATGLAPNSTHTITLNTVDTSGNINTTAVSSTGTTRQEDDDDQDDDDSDADDARRIRTSFADYTPIEQNRTRLADEDPIVLEPIKKKSYGFLPLLLLLAITVLLLIILLVLFFKAE